MRIIRPEPMSLHSRRSSSSSSSSSIVVVVAVAVAVAVVVVVVVVTESARAPFRCIADDRLWGRESEGGVDRVDLGFSVSSNPRGPIFWHFFVHFFAQNLHPQKTIFLSSF